MVCFIYSQDLALEGSVNYMCEVWLCFKEYLPETQDQDVGQEQRGDKHFEELSREDASFLHGSCLPHAESHWTPRVPEMKLPVRKINLSVITTAPYRLQTLFWARKKF